MYIYIYIISTLPLFTNSLSILVCLCYKVAQIPSYLITTLVGKQLQSSKFAILLQRHKTKR